MQGFEPAPRPTTCWRVPMRTMPLSRAPTSCAQSSRRDSRKPRRTPEEVAMQFAEKYGPWAVVAGASDGIGASVARLLGARGVNVMLVARRQGMLDEVAATVATETRTVVLDLSVDGADEALAVAA